jgi:hypothetical protein
MKKLVYLVVAAFVGALAASCVDKSYDTSNLDTNATVSLEITAEESPVSPVNELMKYDNDEAEVTQTQNESGETEITVSSPATEPVTTEIPPQQVEQLNQGEELSLPAACDMVVKIPISKKFPKDDIFKALDNPHFIIKVKNELGIPLKYTATVTNKKAGKSFEIEAEIPAIPEKEISVMVSEKANLAEGKAQCVDAKIISDKPFAEIFKDSPEELKIEDAKVSKFVEVPKSGEVPTGAVSGALEFTAQSVFPFIVKNGEPFTMRHEFDLSGADFSDFIAITALEADIIVKHSLPLKMSLALVEPANIFVECPEVNPSLDGQQLTQELTVKATCPTGATAFPKAVIDLTATLCGNKATYAVNEDSTTISVDVKRNSEGKQLIRVTGRLGDK